MNPAAALVIEEKQSHLIVSTALECAGYHCTDFTSTAALLRGLKRDDHAVVVVDMDHPAAQAGEVLDWRRNWLNPGVVVILLGSGTDASSGVAQALDAGADDFVAKPVRGPELLARLQAARRRAAARPEAQPLGLAGCLVDRNSCSLQSSRGRVELTAREMAVAQLLFESAGEVVTRQRLARHVWGCDCELIGRSIEQHIYQLRRKLKRCIGEAVALRGVYGCGYRLDAVPTTTSTGAGPASARNNSAVPPSAPPPLPKRAAPTLLSPAAAASDLLSA
ncbi:response regulator transcription factor [Caldimonas brevitalea]|uniref:Two-component system response regulator n=1 Tax=Caldimonas brevitalea TaxID=413882 RepID=A0A0G3BKC1_9BURK|nr:response regulator transcription factor [Caldimonas brevitalea]AKJ27806.1 two-component system response regulator [Caldimonas brevitalea]